MRPSNLWRRACLRCRWAGGPLVGGVAEWRAATATPSTPGMGAGGGTPAGVFRRRCTRGRRRACRRVDCRHRRTCEAPWWAGAVTVVLRIGADWGVYWWCASWMGRMAWASRLAGEAGSDFWVGDGGHRADQCTLSSLWGRATGHRPAVRLAREGLFFACGHSRCCRWWRH